MNTIIQEIKDKLTFRDIFQKYNVDFKEGGNYILGLCPFESKPEYALCCYDHNHTAKCFACGFKGSVFDFIMQKESVSFVEAIKRACEILGIQYTPENLSPEQIADWQKEKQETKEAYELLDKKVSEYGINLSQMPDLVEYCQSRGLTLESIKQFRIGFIKQEHDPELLKTGLVIKSKETGNVFSPFNNRLVIPYLDKEGKAVFCIFRETTYTPKPKEEGKDNRFKKLMSNQKIRHPIFYSEVPDCKTLVLAEGIFDALVSIQSGYSTASFITTKPKKEDLPELVSLLLRKKYEKIIVVFDNEENTQGEKGQHEIIETLFKQGHTNVYAYTIPRPEGIKKIDLNDLLKGLTPEDQKLQMQEIEQESIEAIKYLCQNLKFNTAIERKNSYEYIAQLTDPYKKSDELFYVELVKDIAGIIKLKHTAVKKGLDLISKITYKEQKEEAQKQATETNEFNPFMRILNDNFNYRGLAKRIVEEVGVYYNENGVWFIWDEPKARWRIIDDISLMNQVDVALSNTNETLNQQAKGIIIEALKREGRKAEPQEFPKNCVQFKDIIYNYETEESFPATKEYLCFNPVPWRVGQSEDTPIITKLFKEWVGNKSQMLEEIMAYCLAQEYYIQDIFAFVGSGSNGKSTYLGILEKFTGADNCGTVDLDLLCGGSRFELTKIYKKLVAILSETNYKGRGKTGRLKSLSGGDPQGYEFKGKNGELRDKNYAKLIISSNGLPETDDKSIGYNRRWVIIEFNKYFSVGKNPADTIPDWEYENFAKKSLRLLKELRKSYHFTDEETLEEKEKHYERLSNPVKKFIDETYITDPDGKIPVFQFRELLEAYLTKHGQRKLSQQEIGRKVKELGYESRPLSAKKKDGKETTWWYYLGLRDRTGLETYSTPETNTKEQEENNTTETEISIPLIMIDGELPVKPCSKCFHKKQIVAEQGELRFCETCYELLFNQKKL